MFPKIYSNIADCFDKEVKCVEKQLVFLKEIGFPSDQLRHQARVIFCSMLHFLYNVFFFLFVLVLLICLRYTLVGFINIIFPKYDDEDEHVNNSLKM